MASTLDRYGLHHFLGQCRHLITGRALEIQSPGYTREHGHDLMAADSVDVAAETRAAPTYLVESMSVAIYTRKATKQEHAAVGRATRSPLRALAAVRGWTVDRRYVFLR
jgi:hypothetical protein